MVRFYRFAGIQVEDTLHEFGVFVFFFTFPDDFMYHADFHQSEFVWIPMKMTIKLTN